MKDLNASCGMSVSASGSGDILLAGVTTMDISAVCRAMQELEHQLDREAQQRAESEGMHTRLTAVLDTMPDLVAMADREGSVVCRNSAGRAMTGQLAADDDGAGLTLGRCIGQSPSLEGALRHSREELRRLSASHVNMQEDERKRIACDLHDGIGQALTLIKISIEDAARQIPAGVAADASESLRRLAISVRDVLQEVHRISMGLRPSTLDDLGILATLTWYFRELTAVCHGVAVHKAFEATEDQVPGALKLAIYRIVQEATHNVLKHAKASWIRVSLTHEGGTLQLRVSDDGCGFDPQQVQVANGNAKGLGLVSMKERAALSEGTYELRSAPGQGTSIQVIWPVGPEVSSF